MIYSWAVRGWIEQYINPRIRKVKIVALLYCYVKPIEVLHTEFLAKKSEIDRKLKFNSQQMLFAYVLNDLFDATLRRITVVTNDDLIQRTYLYNRTETIDPVKQLYAYNRSANKPAKFIYNRSENIVYADFTVNVPAALLPGIEQALKSEIDYYRLGGKVYKIKAV